MTWTCSAAAGIDTLACISANTNYVPGFAFLVLLVAILFFRLNAEPMRERVAATMLVVALVSALGSYKSMLFPEQFFIVSVVLFIGAGVMLIVRS